MNNLNILTLLIPFLPLSSALLVGLTNKKCSQSLAHRIAITNVGLACLLSFYLLYQMLFNGLSSYGFTLYHWAIISNIDFTIGFMIDRLAILMMCVVTFVSWMVHIYTIGYMNHDDGYQRFFAYISLFTFAMLMLVMGDNLLQLFFGWEGVGLVSYLLIGFWYKKESAIQANLKAFLVNRLGDLGFLLGIAVIFMYFHDLHYPVIFKLVKSDTTLHSLHMTIFNGLNFNVLNVICICLFIGAMGKSAQVPLHVWLPDSMEGPTPISALIHAATMVTAGVFMVARMSPLFEFAPEARSFVLIIGAITTFFMGILGIVQNDIKRIIAYSTLSQLGYMVTALGASAYAAGIFHLMTHAFFKALLFLSAGSVIIAMHHEQDIRHMGGLAKKLPITYITTLIGSLALCGMPLFAGFYSKDMIIEAVHGTHIFGSAFAYYSVLLSVFVTAVYTFRLLFLVFHGPSNVNDKLKNSVHEPAWVVLLPLILLAIPSFLAGIIGINTLLFNGDNNFFGSAIFVLPENNVLSQIYHHEYHGILHMTIAAVNSLPFWLMLAGIFTAWLSCIQYPEYRKRMTTTFPKIYKVLLDKYKLDDLYIHFFAKNGRKIGNMFWQYIDVDIIDNIFVNGSARLVACTSSYMKKFQTGYLYHYALMMIVGLIALFFWLYH